jgi:hypothetical protein
MNSTRDQYESDYGDHIADTLDHQRKEPTMTTVPTPECEKLAAVSDLSQAIGEFIEWAQMQGIQLCSWSDRFREFSPIHESINNILARHFGIDLVKIEDERRAILESLRS